jgi:hypothetical protein
VWRGEEGVAGAWRGRGRPHRVLYLRKSSLAAAQCILVGNW